MLRLCNWDEEVESVIFIKYKEQGVVRPARVKTRDQPKQANKSEKEEVKKNPLTNKHKEASERRHKVQQWTSKRRGEQTDLNKCRETNKGRKCKARDDTEAKNLQNRTGNQNHDNILNIESKKNIFLMLYDTGTVCNRMRCFKIHYQTVNCNNSPRHLWWKPHNEQLPYHQLPSGSVNTIIWLFYIKTLK